MWFFFSFLNFFSFLFIRCLRPLVVEVCHLSLFPLEKALDVLWINIVLSAVRLLDAVWTSTKHYFFCHQCKRETFFLSLSYTLFFWLKFFFVFLFYFIVTILKGTQQQLFNQGTWASRQENYFSVVLCVDYSLRIIWMFWSLERRLGFFFVIVLLVSLVKVLLGDFKSLRTYEHTQQKWDFYFCSLYASQGVSLLRTLQTMTNTNSAGPSNVNEMTVLASVVCLSSRM